MRQVNGVLAYAGAWTVVLIGLFTHVNIVLWSVCLFLAVFGALVAWAGPAVAPSQPERDERGKAGRGDAFDMFT